VQTGTRGHVAHILGARFEVIAILVSLAGRRAPWDDLVEASQARIAEVFGARVPIVALDVAGAWGLNALKTIVRNETIIRNALFLDLVRGDVLFSHVRGNRVFRTHTLIRQTKLVYGDLLLLGPLKLPRHVSCLDRIVRGLRYPRPARTAPKKPCDRHECQRPFTHRVPSCIARLKAPKHNSLYRNRCSFSTRVLGAGAWKVRPLAQVLAMC